MTQPPYGPPPQGPPVPGPGQPPYGPPPGHPTQAWPQGQPPYPPQQGWQVTPNKPPFYKRPWVIVVGAIVALAVIGSAIDKGDAEEASNSAAASSSSQAPASTTPVEAPVTPPPAPPAVVPPTTEAQPTAPATPVVDFVMPDFVGMDLQTAQNLVQTHGVFLSLSHDLLGSRNQLLDSNWLVCDQNIPAGERVTGDAEGTIDFGVVKREESCP